MDAEMAASSLHRYYTLNGQHSQYRWHSNYDADGFRDSYDSFVRMDADYNPVVSKETLVSESLMCVMH